jgi:hypothetical protein
MKSKVQSPLPFMNQVGDGFELMKKMWGMAGLPDMPNPGNLAAMAVRLPQQLPSMMAPTLDVDELDKRISDLRAVEQWLELNATMLRTTIQTLEVQRATIATLKGISGAVLAPLARTEARLEPTPLATFASPAPPLDTFASPSPPPAAAELPVVRKAPRRRSGHKDKAATTPSVVQAPLSPAAWWNTLQDQFTKIAAAAAAAPPPPDEKSDKASTKRRPKRRTRKAKPA